MMQVLSQKRKKKDSIQDYYDILMVVVRLIGEDLPNNKVELFVRVPDRSGQNFHISEI